IVTSSPYFSKKPRSTAIGNASMSTAATMPTLSFTGSLACASASDGNNSKEQSSSAIRLIMVILQFVMVILQVVVVQYASPSNGGRRSSGPFVSLRELQRRILAHRI